MSEVAQGPGWWRASDGRWYPPELHPGYQRPPPTPPAASPPDAAGGYPQFTSAPAAAAWRQPAHLSITATTWLMTLGSLGIAQARPRPDVVFVIFTALTEIWRANAGNFLHGASNDPPAVGAFVCWTAVVLIWVGIARLWRQGRRSTASPPIAR